jgi:hypothetical protein
MRGKGRGTRGMSEMNTVLLLFDKLSSVSHGPAQVPELLDYLQSALDRGAITAGVGEYAHEILKYEPSDLFVTLDELEREGWVTREAMGFAVTEAGHRQAHELRADLDPDVVNEIALAADAA